ncbi:hypothetical protein QMG61_01065 [Cryobacterium sp. PH31-AA6]|uniref:hypothetical protein n=1 Tax=Cryobacterium sp. PH31-AA6 TaxID=3046205 RepID=UPI0024BA1B29|nr:hypothetical protein [Cryobacterium sp. PH31-AA6]MDJ0322355.1 hypothetical protein [Cryobacterium sp. PH31-AA6]
MRWRTERAEGTVNRKAFRKIAQAPRCTAAVTREDRAHIDDVRYAPVSFRQFVPADLDLRVIVVSQEIFAASIRSEPEYRTGIGSAEINADQLPDVAAARVIYRRLCEFLPRLGSRLPHTRNRETAKPRNRETARPRNAP